MQRIRRRFAILLLTLCLTVPLFAESTLFVTSAPIGAEVTINGTAVGTTPLIRRGVEPGEYEVAVIKAGFEPAIERLEIGADEVRVLEFRPAPSVFVGAFSADQTIVNGEPLDRTDATLAMPSGVYDFSADASALRLTPFYPNEGALRAARIVTIAGGIAATIATVEDVFVRGEATSYFSSYLPSAGTIAAWVITAGAGGYWIALSADRAAYEERMTIAPYEGGITPADAEQYYNRAEIALEAGNLARALESYSRVIADGGDSEYIPDALYKTARIYSISGDAQLAERLFELLLESYPAPDVYDRALRSLSEIYRQDGRYDRAIQSLEQILYVDESYVPAEIQEEINAIREERDREAGR